ncbi:hypothetical protein RHGRI_001402 [Rhododendron griersonianum]|uniref:Uncharacterized protein n=1 Tax=Rhododendron griersonianum TaxID=479676 RepID=A0AAV6LNY4_9ERIC|nr:hypothetical protein RHGRI_001402 [Rhododendron griersonianum]
MGNYLKPSLSCYQLPAAYQCREIAATVLVHYIEQWWVVNGDQCQPNSTSGPSCCLLYYNSFHYPLQW